MRLYLIIAVCFLLSSCVRLDSMVYDNSALSEYKLDDYEGEVDFKLPIQYHIPETSIHFKTFEVNGNTIHGIYIGDTSTIAADTVIMYCHGNFDHMDFYWPRAKLLANLGGNRRFGVMMVDYQGFGMSEGDPYEVGLVEDVNAALTWLKGRGLSSDRLWSYGFSLGTYPAIKICTDGVLTPTKLGIEAPFASTDVMAADGSLLDMPVDFFASTKLSNAENIKQVTQPLCWIHGEEDPKLNIDTHGDLVYRNHGAVKEAHRIPEADHSSIQETMGFAEYLDVLEAFYLK